MAIWRPEKLAHIIGQPTNGLQRYVDDKQRGSKCFLLSGPPGVGKSATAHALCNELGVSETKPLLVKVCASELTIDLIRELFQRTFRLSFPWKALVIEELDGMTSKQAERELKVALDPHNMPSRLTVIATSNDAENLPVAILDRFTHLSYRGDQTFAAASRAFIGALWAATKNVPLPSEAKEWGKVGKSYSLRNALMSMEDA